jgi:hypothetical protein
LSVTNPLPEQIAHLFEPIPPQAWHDSVIYFPFSKTRLVPLPRQEEHVLFPLLRHDVQLCVLTIRPNPLQSGQRTSGFSCLGVGSVVCADKGNAKPNNIQMKRRVVSFFMGIDLV